MMQNETQNQNIDSQEAKVEEAPVQTEAPQEQNIGVKTDQYRGSEAEEPADITDPKVTMHPEDLSGPGTAEGPGFDDGTSIEDISSEPLAGDLFGNDNVDYFVEPVDESSWGDAGWDSGFYGQDEPGSDGSIWDFFSPDVPEDTTAGGYDGSGIAGGLDQNGMPENTGINPHVQPDFPGNEPVGQHEGNVIPDEAGINPDTSDEGYTYDENAYEDAEDSLEDLQDALQDGDEEDLAEALEELQDYLGGFDKSDEEDQVQTDPEGHGSIPNVVQESPTSREESEEQPDSRPESSEDHDNHDDKEDKQDQNESPGNMSDEEGYTYDEDDYEDAEDALEDLRDALKHGDEEERAEALEDLQDYLGGFDKGGAEEDQTGEWITGINGDVWVDASGKAWDSPEQAKAAAQLPQDEENGPHNHGASEEVSNSVDKDPVDAPDASEAAVSGAAVGAAAGAAVGAAGAVGEAGGLGETIDDALGIDGAGKVLDDLSEGDWGEAAEGALEAGLDYLGVEGADEILDGLSE